MKFFVPNTGPQETRDERVVMNWVQGKVIEIKPVVVIDTEHCNDSEEVRRARELLDLLKMRVVDESVKRPGVVFAGGKAPHKYVEAMVTIPVKGLNNPSQLAGLKPTELGDFITCHQQLLLVPRIFISRRHDGSFETLFCYRVDMGDAISALMVEGEYPFDSRTRWVYILATSTEIPSVHCSMFFEDPDIFRDPTGIMCKYPRGGCPFVVAQVIISSSKLDRMSVPMRNLPNDF